MQFVMNTWYFAAWSSEIETKPLHRRICGEDVAFFRDSSGTVQAIDAVCPHRGANLGNGRIVDGAIQCPYHGWRFDGGGRCVRVPSQPDDHRIPSSADVPTYHVAEQQGIVWIWPNSSTAPTREAPRYDLFDDERSLMRSAPALLECEFINVVENAFDDSHVHFLHTTSVGVETPILPRQLVDRDEDGLGLTMRWDVDSPWGLELFAATDSPRSRFARWLITRYGRTDYDARHARFRLGGVVMFDIPTVNGHTQTIIGAATPMDDRRTWFTTALSHPLVRNPIARPAVRWFLRTINKEDRVGTIDLLRPASQLKPILVKADRGSVAFRNLYTETLRQEREAAVGLTEVTVSLSDESVDPDLIGS